MSVDFDALLRQPLLVLGLLLAFLAIKGLVLWGLARAIGLPWQERPVFALLLGQGGEFAFVVFQAAAGARVLDAETTSLLIGAVALSMLLTPLLLVAFDRWVLPRYAQVEQRHVAALLEEPQDAPIIIAGFGRYGQIVGRMLYANGLKATVLEHDAEQIDFLRRFDFRPLAYSMRPTICP